jgi:hypothetical protein
MSSHSFSLIKGSSKAVAKTIQSATGATNKFQDVNYENV